MPAYTVNLLVHRPPAAAVTTGANPPLNGGFSVVKSATFQAGGAVWTYTRGTVEKLECPGPLNTSVRIQVKGTLHWRTSVAYKN